MCTLASGAIADAQGSFSLSLSTGSIDEGVTEGLQSIQGTPNTTGHMEEDERQDFLKFFFVGVFLFLYRVSFYNVSLL